MAVALTVCERGVAIDCSFDDLMRFHGVHSPGGVAHAFKVLERALPLLAGGRPPGRGEIAVRTAFGGPPAPALVSSWGGGRGAPAATSSTLHWPGRRSDPRASASSSSSRTATRS